MPGYYDWKIRNCPQGAIAKAESLLATVEAVDVYLEKLWAAGDGSFTPEVNAHLAKCVAVIDEAEDCLEKAKLMLAEFFPGHPNAAPIGAGKKG